MIRTVVSAAALACAIAASPVLANEPMAKVQGRVAYRDLDLSNPDHLAKLNQRIEEKARDLCIQGIDKGWRGSPEVEACEASVIASGQKRIAALSSADRARRLANHH